MALFTSYAPPGVYTTEIFNPQSSAAIGTSRIPVIIGEGQQFFSFPNIELFRGSSAQQDDQAVNEDISDQITGFGRNFNTTYFPVVDGTGKGIVTNDPTKVQVISIDSNGNQLPVTVISLVGATGAFATQEIIPAGYTLKITYFFKRGDTLVTNENLSYQIPTFASTVVTPSGGNHVTVSTANPGALGNLVSLRIYLPVVATSSQVSITNNVATIIASNGFLPGQSVTIMGLSTSVLNGTWTILTASATQFTFSVTTGDVSLTNDIGTITPNGVPDAQAVTGAGTDAIIIWAMKVSGTRTLTDLVNLINAGIPTLDAGYLTVGPITGVASTALVATSAVLLAGGAGGSSNTVFKVGMANEPVTLENSLDVSTGRNIVDGTNGGVVTTNPSLVTAEVNGLPVAVTAVDGSHGLITLAAAINVGGLYSNTVPTLTATYYTNTWQNTYDLLPASNVSSITAVGLGPNRQDFAEGIDYVLGVDSQGNGTINWGASVTETVGTDTAGDVPFSPSEVFSSLVDDQVFLRPVTGAVNGKNVTFTLQDTPVDGSGLSRITDDPSLVKVYVGVDPLTAFQAGNVLVARLVGATSTVTLYNPPPISNNVYASYYRSTLADHQYSVSVVTPGYSGFGTYKITNELGKLLPVDVLGSTTVAAGGFATTGVVYPYSFPDVWSPAGAVDETVTLTFNNDGSIVTGAAQAFVTTQSLTFRATNTGTAPNGVTSVTFIGATPDVADASAIQTNTQAVAWQANQPYTVGQVINDGVALQVVTTPGTSNNTIPTFNDTPGMTTTDGPNLVWTCLSLKPTAEQILIFIVNLLSAARTTASIQALFGTYGPYTTPDAGTIIVTGGTGSQASANAAVFFASGSAGSSVPYTHSYVVTSTAGASGSHGTGYLDQTYVDATTGFRVTIVNPADHVSFGVPIIPASYSFAPSDVLTYTVTKAAPRYTGNPGVLPSQANNWVAIPGLHNKVSSTFGSTTGDTVVVSTFSMSGNNPNVGEFYYVSFTTEKTAADYALKLYTNPSDAYAVYGQPSTVNRMSLGIQLMALNGVQTFGAIQVPVQPNTNYAASSDYIAALQQLTKNLPGFNSKVNVVVPLSNDPSVHQALSRQLTTQAGPRYKGEAIGFVGYSQFTTAAQASANAQALDNMRMIAIGNAAAGILITNPTTGVAVEYPVDGTFMAAAMAGLNCNPTNDVATTLTLQNMAGFSRLLITYDDPTMDSMAAAGLTMLLNNNGALQIRHYKTTDPSNDLTSEPTSVTIADYVAQQFRLDLQQFIGRKLVDSLVTDIQTVCNSRLSSLVNNVIISGYQNLSVVEDPNDPTQVDVTVTFKPIFSLLYASVTFVVQTSL